MALRKKKAVSGKEACWVSVSDSRHSAAHPRPRGKRLEAVASIEKINFNLYHFWCAICICCCDSFFTKQRGRKLTLRNYDSKIVMQRVGVDAAASSDALLKLLSCQSNRT